MYTRAGLACQVGLPGLRNELGAGEARGVVDWRRLVYNRWSPRGGLGCVRSALSHGAPTRLVGPRQCERLSQEVRHGRTLKFDSLKL